MNRLRENLLRSIVHRGALLLVATVGCSLTGWVAHQMYSRAEDGLQQPFQRAAQTHAERILGTFDEPIKHFTVLQRFFHSVGKIEWDTFERFVNPLVGQSGMLGVGWAPRVERGERQAFEQQSARLLGTQYAIADFDETGQHKAAPEREAYFPVLYNLPESNSRVMQGVDLKALRHALISRAIDEAHPVSSGIVFSYSNPKQEGRSVVFMAPVYRGGAAPLSQALRRAEIKGVLAASFDVDHLLRESQIFPTPSHLRATVFDEANPEQPIARWEIQPLPETTAAASGEFGKAGRSTCRFGDGKSGSSRPRRGCARICRN